MVKTLQPVADIQPGPAAGTGEPAEQQPPPSAGAGRQRGTGHRGQAARPGGGGGGRGCCRGGGGGGGCSAHAASTGEPATGRPGTEQTPRLTRPGVVRQ